MFLDATCVDTLAVSNISNATKVADGAVSSAEERNRVNFLFQNISLVERLGNAASILATTPKGRTLTDWW